MAITQVTNCLTTLTLWNLGRLPFLCEPRCVDMFIFGSFTNKAFGLHLSFTLFVITCAIHIAVTEGVNTIA